MLRRTRKYFYVVRLYIRMNDSEKKELTIVRTIFHSLFLSTSLSLQYCPFYFYCFIKFLTFIPFSTHQTRLPSFLIECKPPYLHFLYFFFYDVTGIVLFA